MWNKKYFAPPIGYDEVMKKIPYGKVIAVEIIREYFAKLCMRRASNWIKSAVFVERQRKKCGRF